jgi:ssDNA-binding Zn-finger/Zn-ribbon topoisomerase 1
MTEAAVIEDEEEEDEIPETCVPCPDCDGTGFITVAWDDDTWDEYTCDTCNRTRLFVNGVEIPAGWVKAP